MKVYLVAQTQVDPDYVKHLLKTIPDLPEEYKDIIKSPEGLVAYMARVSSPNQTNTKHAGLIRFCMKHGHWSILETCNITIEVKTSRMIAPQLLRHRSFSFQELSQRYSAVTSDGIEIYVARRQDQKNRQNSIDDLSDDVKAEWIARQEENWKTSFEHYKWALDNNIAKECARAVLPLQTTTRVFINGTIRSWVHYINVRSDPASQKEHRDIANAIKDVFIEKLPIISEAAEWVGHQKT